MLMEQLFELYELRGYTLDIPDRFIRTIRFMDEKTANTKKISISLENLKSMSSKEYNKFLCSEFIKFLIEDGKINIKEDKQ